MNRRALFLSPEAPYPLAGGGALRSASLLNFLAREYAVDVIVFREPGADDPRLHVPLGLAQRLEVIELPAHSRHTLARAARNTGRLVRRIPPLVDRFAGFEERIAAVTRGQHYELGIVEHFWCAPYWQQVAAVSDATILDLHNIESILHQRCARDARGPQAFAHRVFQVACRALEQEWLPRFTYLLATSEADAHHLHSILPVSNVLIYPNSIRFTALPVARKENAIVFSGNLEYHPNISAVRYFHREVWPALRRRWPGLIWRLVGKNPGAVAKIVKGDPQIELSGAVADAIPELARAKLAIVPLRAGSGTRIKILEAWAAGLPVVSTSLGAEGLPALSGEHLLLADDALGFEQAVSSLLADPALAEKIGRAGRYLYECEFTWETAWKRLHLLDPCYHG